MVVLCDITNVGLTKWYYKLGPQVVLNLRALGQGSNVVL